MKRCLDFVISLLALVLLSPLIAVVSLVILFDDGAPVVFSQERIGLDGRKFRIYKFRTMKKGARIASTEDLTDDEANELILRSGRFLRKTSLDELLQLVNVLNGTMSLVGPRPLIPEEENVHALRREYNVYSVRPGITGWAQVNGRDFVTAEEKALLDKEYVDKQSIGFDIKILLRTVMVVLKREDIK